MSANDIVRSLLESDDFDVKSFIQNHGQQLDGPSRKHLFVSSADGGLYDTRKPDWHKGPPVRANYQKYNARIFNVNDLKSTWRARHMSNYPLAFQLSDGALMCEKCVEDNLRQIINSTKYRHNDGWRVVGVGQCHGGGDGEPEEHDSQCAQCNKNLGEVA
jgi:hypothetical protein